MGSIPLPALNIRTPEQPDLLQNYSRLLALKNMQQQSQLQQQEAPLRQQALQQQVRSGQLQLDQQQQAQKDQEAFRVAAADPKLQGKTIGEIADVLAQSGNISQGSWQAAKKADLEHRETLQKLDTQKLAEQKAAHDATQQVYNGVMNLPDDQVAANWPSIVQQIKLIPGNENLQLNPAQPLNKQQLSQFGPLLTMQSAYLDQTIARREADAKAKTAEQTAEQGGTTESARFTADYLKANGLDNTPANRQKAFKEYTKETKLEPAAVRAEVFLQQPQAVFNPETGQNEFTTRKNAIGQIAPSSADALAAKGGVQADIASLKKMQTNFDNVTAFENTAGKNLDTFLKTAKGVIDSGSPLINSPLRSVSDRMAGSDKQAAFNAARATALTEISKVLNSSNASGVLSDSARHEVGELIGPNATLKQVYAAANILKQDMANRRTSYQDQINEIKGRMSGHPSQPSGGDFIVQNGHKYRVTARDKDGKVTAAEPAQ
jgi:hypothetical protein